MTIDRQTKGLLKQWRRLATPCSGVVVAGCMLCDLGIETELQNNKKQLGLLA